MDFHSLVCPGRAFSALMRPLCIPPQTISRHTILQEAATASQAQRCASHRQDRMHGVFILEQRGALA